MTERERCHCGAIPTTIDGYCHKHAPARPAPKLEEQLAECKRARHQLNEALIEARNRISQYYTLIMRLKAGTTTIEEIDQWI